MVKLFFYDGKISANDALLFASEAGPEMHLESMDQVAIINAGDGHTDCITQFENIQAHAITKDFAVITNYICLLSLVEERDCYFWDIYNGQWLPAKEFRHEPTYAKDENLEQAYRNHTIDEIIDSEPDDSDDE